MLPPRMNTEQQNAPQAPLPSRPWWGKPWFQGLALTLLAFIGMLQYQFVPGFVTDADGNTGLYATSVGLPGADGYYHIKMAWLYRTGEVGEAGGDFHWTRESLWNGEFSDKDYLFHVYLVPFTLFADGPGDAQGLITGAKLGISVLGALLVLSLFTALRLLGARWAWLFTLGLIAVGGSYFVFRMNLCRSYVVSVTLALAGWTLIVRRQRLGLLALSTIYTLSYTASHLLLAMLLVRTVMELVLGAREGSTRRRDLKDNALMGAAIAGGIALGCLLHPESWNLVKLWWVQNVVVLALSHKDTVAPVIDNISGLFGTNTDYGNAVEVALGRELNPTAGPAAVFGTPLIFFPPMLLPLAAAVMGWRPSREAVLTATIAVVWLVGYLVNGRFLEYAAPFMTLAIGVWVTELLTSAQYQAWKERRPVVGRALPISGAVIAVIATLSIWVGAAISYRVHDRGDIELAAVYLHEHPETHGKLVWHDRWDDFTELLFFASECDYLAGLDPTFFLLKDRKKYEDWWDVKRGKRRDVLGPIRDDFKADYILAHRSSSEYFYNRLNEEARAGNLKLLIRAPDDEWALYEVLPKPAATP
ncbi:MAG: hypothetical protein ICCCNLDF_03535 [Planctomycetes bacterium]|nr:hypothetical protein [Planctomycetota bacterium]